MTRTFAFAVALVALFVAGCGGKGEHDVTKAEYERQLDQIGNDLYSAANALGQSTNRQIFIDGVGKLQDVIDDSADDLDAMRPPGLAAQTANNRLVGAYRELADEFDKVKDARRDSFPRAIAALQQVQKSAAARETINAAQKLRQLGFKVPVSATIGSV